MDEIVVTSTSPGRFGAGELFTGARTFPLDRFSGQELRELIADTVLTVVVGKQLTAETVDEFVAGVEAGKSKKASKA